MIKVLVVDDSPVARQLLTHILGSDPEIEVVGTAADGAEAVEMIARNRPDVVTMDVIMPKMDGYQATRRIMETTPLPIIMVSASPRAEEAEKTWRAVEAGAVATLAKPGMHNTGPWAGSADRLVQTVKTMSQVKVVRRWGKRPAQAPAAEPPSRVMVQMPRPDVRIVAIGASTGGPNVLQEIFSRLPASFSAPILLVQHISPGFVTGFIDWLNHSSSLKIRLAQQGEQTLPGNIYVAPDSHQMKIDPDARIVLTTDEAENGIRPSVSFLFRSVAQSFGRRAVGVLLTGMGRDGAAELKIMRERGAVTIAQDKESCIVYGMPAEAVKMGGAKHSLPPDKITEMLQNLVGGTWQ